MRICIFGAGAIGGYLGAKLAAAGAEVSLVARGPHLEAMRRQRPDARSRAAETTVPVSASRRSGGARPAGLRDHHPEGAFGAGGASAGMQPLLGPDTAVVTASERRALVVLPRLGGPLDGTRLESGRSRRRAVGRRSGRSGRIGCVVYPAAEVERARRRAPHRGRPASRSASRTASKTERVRARCRRRWSRPD